VATIGLHASASTWVFNVVRELMIAAVGSERVLALYADRMEQIHDQPERSGRHIVIKSHHGSAELDAWLAAEQAPMILSVRDPRDACLSMAQRFNAPLNHTVVWMANDCQRMMRLAAYGHLMLRYEDRFFDDFSAVGRVADALGLAPPVAETAAIFARYTTEAVRSFARKLSELPPDRLATVGEPKVDRLTQIHEPHIGDGSSGKWRNLPVQIRTELTRRFGPFLERFGYELGRSPTIPLKS